MSVYVTLINYASVLIPAEDLLALSFECRSKREMGGSQIFPNMNKINKVIKVTPTVHYLLELLQSILNYFLIEKCGLINQKDITLRAFRQSKRISANVVQESTYHSQVLKSVFGIWQTYLDTYLDNLVS